jgi:5-methylcytosine-specific restriction protein A
MPTMPPRHRPPGQPTREESLRRMRAAADKARPSLAGRGYDQDWAKLRARFLRDHPVCCCGCGEVATVVDHIQPIRTHPHLRLQWSNLRAMAKVCHDQHTARTQGFGRSRR